MSHLESLNDPELDSVQQSLAEMALRPSAAQRERLIYECGRAAGRAESMWWARRASVVAALLLCGAVGLGYLAARRSVEVRNAAPTVVEAGPEIGGQVDVACPTTPDGDQGILRASARFDDFWNFRAEFAETPEHDPATVSLEPVMTTISVDRLDVF